jgi:hypothetical protein
LKLWSAKGEAHDLRQSLEVDRPAKARDLRAR